MPWKVKPLHLSGLILILDLFSQSGRNGFNSLVTGTRRSPHMSFCWVLTDVPLQLMPTAADPLPSQQAGRDQISPIKRQHPQV